MTGCPAPEKTYEGVPWYSFVDGQDGWLYYDAHQLEHMYDHLTLLAYEPTTSRSGSSTTPRFACATSELGYKLVKGVQAVEFVESFGHLDGGRGGYNADHEFFGYRATI